MCLKRAERGEVAGEKPLSLGILSLGQYAEHLLGPSARRLESDVGWGPVGKTSSEVKATHRSWCWEERRQSAPADWSEEGAQLAPVMGRGEHSR